MPMRYTGETVESNLVYDRARRHGRAHQGNRHTARSRSHDWRVRLIPTRKLLTKRKSQLTVLKNMIGEIVDGKIQTTYHRCFMNTGRRYANGPSLQKCSSVVRSTSARYYYDVDMRNAHPAIVAHIVENQSGLEPSSFPSLIRYGTAEKEEREAILREVAVHVAVHPQEGKAALCFAYQRWHRRRAGRGRTGCWSSSPYFGPPSCTHTAPRRGELIHLMAAEKPDIVKLSRECIQTKKRRDIELYHKSRALNVTMQQYEDRILSVMETHAESAGWRFDVLIYDGALLRRREDKTDTDVQTLMRTMEDEIEEKDRYPNRPRTQEPPGRLKGQTCGCVCVCVCVCGGVF